MTTTTKFFSALAAVALGATVLTAQPPTDVGTTGTGAGVGGSIAPLGLPGARGGGGGNALSGAGASGLAGARANFMRAGAGGATVTNPMGGTVVVPQAAALALGAVLGGSPTTAQTATLTTALGGIPAGPVGALVRALTAFGGNSSHTTLSAATTAYNNAVAALPTGTPVPPALLAIRQALLAAAQR